MLVTPALADANNGNWQTARRWSRLLAPAYRVQLTGRWEPGDAGADVMVALHARRSAVSIAAWREACPRAPLVVVLTGTDLYRDIASDAAAQRSLQLADALVVLNELGARSLPAALQARCQVVLQSCGARQVRPKSSRLLRAVAVGHLREEKDPATLFAAVQLLASATAAARAAPTALTAPAAGAGHAHGPPTRAHIRIDHIGRALDAALGEQAHALAAQHPDTYRWLGGLTHEQARRRIQAAHLLVHPSRMEGGAHVVIEALRSGTPVLASRIDGNVGLLGADWGGYFEPGDAVGLARCLEQLRHDPDMLEHLRQQALARAPRFEPAAEAAALRAVIDPLVRAARTPARP